MFPTIHTFSGRVKTDNFVFALHYRWTVLLLVFCSFVVTCRLLMGHSFSCQQVVGVTKDHLETKCYSDGVYSFPAQLIRNDPGAQTQSIRQQTRSQRSSSKQANIQQANIQQDSNQQRNIQQNNIQQGNIQQGNIHQASIHGFRRYQHFYRWGNLLFVVQAALFCLPHLVWKSYESGTLEKLTRGLDKEDTRGTELCYLAKYILTTQGRHKTYAGVHVACEVSNYIISLSQALWLVHFFKVTGVPDSLPFSLTSWTDFQKFYFPSSGTCSITIDRVHHSTPCLLPLNDLHMYLFLCVHAWYVCLTVLTGAVLVFRLVMLAPSSRAAVVRISCPWAEKEMLASLCRRMSYADWFFLTRLQKAMSDIDFAQMLDKIAVVAACNTCDGVRRESMSSVDGQKDLADESPV